MSEEDSLYVYERDLEDGRAVWVLPRLFNTIIIIGVKDSMFYDSHWCYKDVFEAITAAEQWNPLEQKEPEGWFRHAASGRRRPDGDKSKEYVEL